ncbi:MAG: AraC family transcriptional regulator ligand-binding domain-containing protein [Myxococcaceae bacterium]|nr:AraC family transcriptional regulator ligand-binding domain-containing protein [Myxococcaceae bacterium]
MLRALAELGFSLPPPRGDVVASSDANQLFDAAAAKLKSETVGLDVARRVPIGALGMLDYALCTSPTLREGLSRTARFYAVATQRVKLTLLEDAATATLHFERVSGVNHSRHWIEFSYAMIAERIRGTLGAPVKFREVSFTHGPPAASQAHDTFFGTKVTFAAPRDVLVFDAGLLPLPLRTASSALAEVLELKMKALEPELAHDDLVRRAKEVVQQLLDKNDTSLDALAAKLDRPKRTLQRELSRRGTSHQTLVDEARRTKAQALLETGATVADVSERLGFSEPSAFFRAFRRWTGETPKRRRRR